MANIGMSGHRGTYDQKNSSAVLRTGIVLPKKHPTDPSAYYVNFGQKTTDSSGRLDSGIWCSNGLNSFTRYRDANNNPVSYGSFTPIQPYTHVNVLMADGGRGNPTIIGFPPTNTSVPDIENTDRLHVIGLTPLGSTIEMDDKVGAIRLLYNKGESSLSLADNIISMELNQGDTGGKKFSTGISMRKGALNFKIPDGMMQFDETGFSISFNDGGTSFRITKKGVFFEGMELFKVASQEQVSLKGSKVTIEGTKDASLTASELKIGGKQLTNITGTQINIESRVATSIKSLAVNIFAWSKIQEFAALKDETILGSSVRTAAIISDASALHTTTTGVDAKAAGLIAMDANIMSNMGLGASIATPTYTANKATMVAIHEALTLFGTNILFKAAPLVAMNKILADTIAGASEPAQEPSGNASGTRDKADTQSYGSVAASNFIRNREVMEKFSTVSPLLDKSANGRGSAASAALDYAHVNYTNTSSNGTSNNVSSSSGKSSTSGIL